MIQEQKDAIETIIDRTGVCATLEMVAQICSEKSSFIEETWQDATLSFQWEEVSKAVQQLADMLQNNPTFNKHL